MRLLHQNVLPRFLAALLMLLFVGDLAADSIADLSDGHCGSQTSQSSEDHGKEPCSHCACAAHAGAVVAPAQVLRVHRGSQPASLLRGEDATTPPRLVSPIDHPPQLA
jgi:hypothetical protein